MSFLGSMPSTVAFARASAGWCYNAGGTLTSAPSGTPRFDYNPATLTLNGLLLEEQRQNIQLQSQFNGTGWSTSGGGYSANSVVAPDGTTTAARLTEDTSTGGHFITPSASVSITSGATYAVSAYIKAGTRQYVALNFSKSTNNYATVVFDVVNGLVGESAVGSGSGTVYSKSIQNVGNGWFRCSMVCSVVEPAIYGAIVGATILTGNAYTSGGQPSYTGTSATFYVWGYHLELGALL